MKKQIVYVKLIPRLFATTIDLFLLSIIFAPLMQIVTKWVYRFAFREFLAKHIDGFRLMDFTNQDALMALAKSSEFVNYMSSKEGIISYMLAFAIVSFVNIFVIMLFFLSFWHYTGSTPGKMLLKIKIVDAQTFEKPSTIQFVKRVVSYSLSLFGIWLIPFSAKHQALHDKIADTVVIKS